MKRQPYPLQWPSDWERTDPHTRARSALHGQFARNRDSIIRQLTRRGAANIVITSDLPLRRDGLPYAAGSVADPGIAVYWTDTDGIESVIACDCWDRVMSNLRSIDKTIDAIRGIGRWGSTGIAKRIFQGFARLGAGDGTEIGVTPRPPPPKAWREALGGEFPAGIGPEDLLALAKARYRRLMVRDGAHPDQGAPTEDRLRELNAAMAEAEAELERAIAAGRRTV